MQAECWLGCIAGCIATRQEASQRSLLWGQGQLHSCLLKLHFEEMVACDSRPAVFKCHTGRPHSKIAERAKSRHVTGTAEDSALHTQSWTLQTADLRWSVALELVHQACGKASPAESVLQQVASHTHAASASNISPKVASGRH